MARMVITSTGRHAYGASLSASDGGTVMFAGQFSLIENGVDVVIRRGIRQGTRTTLVNQPNMAERQAVDAATFALLPNWLVQRCEVNRDNGDYRDDMAQETILRLLAKHGASNVNAWELCAWCDTSNPYYAEITSDAFKIVAVVTREYGKNNRADGLTHFQTHGGKVTADMVSMAQSVDALLGTVAEPVDEGDTGANSRAERMAWEIRRLLSPKQLEAVQLKAKGEPLTSTQRVQLKYARDKLGKLGVLPSRPVKAEPTPRIERDKYVSDPMHRIAVALGLNAQYAPQLAH